jgi:glycosyltransferase involved in cell wall biosynthesis
MTDTVKTYRILFENLRLTGGVRQALKLVDELGADRVTLSVVFRKIRTPKDVFGIIKDLIIALKNKPKKAHLSFQVRPAISTENHIIISTSRATLKNVCDINSENHIHYFQHIEAWDFLNSNFFLERCQSIGYPDAKEIGELMTRSLSEADRDYLLSLEKIKNFYVVSDFLQSFLSSKNPTANIVAKEVRPHINSAQLVSIKKSADLLFFIRGIKFKGDDLVFQLLEHYKNMELDINVVVSTYVKGKIHGSNISYHYMPTDKELVGLYSKTKIVISSSLCEGFGSVPQEALKFGCSVVASNTGWLLDKPDGDNLLIVEKHTKEKFIDKIDRLLGAT